MVKAILFDKDGTLFGFDATWGPWTADVLSALAQDDAQLTAKLAEAVAFDLATQTFRPESPVIAGTPDEAARALSPLLSDWSTEGLATHISRSAMSVQPVEAAPLRPLLGQLGRDYKLGVMTNDAEQAAHVQLERCGVASCFDVIVGFDSGFGAKPDAAPLLACAGKLGVLPGEMLMVGDSAHDLNAATAAGCIPLGVLTGPASRADLLAAGAIAVLDDIGELPGWLAGR